MTIDKDAFWTASVTRETYFKGSPQTVAGFAMRVWGATSVGDWLRRRPEDLLDRASRVAGGRRGARRGVDSGTLLLLLVLEDELETERIAGYALWYISFEREGICTQVSQEANTVHASIPVRPTQHARDEHENGETQ